MSQVTIGIRLKTSNARNQVAVPDDSKFGSVEQLEAIDGKVQRGGSVAAKGREGGAEEGFEGGDSLAVYRGMRERKPRSDWRKRWVCRYLDSHMRLFEYDNVGQQQTGVRRPHYLTMYIAIANILNQVLNANCAGNHSIVRLRSDTRLNYCS